MFLSDSTIRNLALNAKKNNLNKNDWKNGNWDKVKDSILIDPFFESNIGPCSYDLTVGNEYLSLRNPREIQKISNNGEINIGPGETVLILSQEYLAFPKDIAAFVNPRARWLIEGTSVYVTRIEPTWYGKLLISFKNHGNSNIRLLKGEEFCTSMFLKLDHDIENVLTKDRVNFLGREVIGRVSFNHVTPIPERQINTVILEDLDQVVQRYGPPWDIARGAIHRIKDKAEEYLAGDLGPDLVKQAASIAIKDSYDKQHKIIIASISIFSAIILLMLGILYKALF